ncbi:DEAD/DEAH box helicase [Bacteroidetes/Chlorobi group bacterium Naka2016]|jgi:SNF2 family DNA or RNA helicase|nr:MAG: DEAD/DEAH box helicase [Bacteroidetes/Chlorobi group bacterium Naka2016]
MLWDHQVELARKAEQILRERKIVYLAMEMRVGKTLIALETCYRLGAKKVFFVTKKKAVASILNDYFRENYHSVFSLDVTNYERVHKYNSKEYDVVIVDEAHSLGAFPRPSLRTRRLKEFVGEKYLILLSGTPTPESFSQIFHQFWISAYSPFGEKRFYDWAKNFVDVRERIINGYKINDYSNAREDLIRPIIAPYFLTFTQKQAGFKFLHLEDQVLLVKADTIVYQVMEHLLKNRYVRLQNKRNGQFYEILADTAAKLLTKIHQVCSGTVIAEGGESIVLDATKAYFIRERIGAKQIAVYYKFQAEGEVLRKVFPNHTFDPAEFARDPNLVFLSQIQSGSMGIDLSTAKAIVFYNIDFSFMNYWQARNRIQNRLLSHTPKIFWVFIEGGIESKILDVVRRKRDYTSYYFRKDFLGANQNQTVEYERADASVSNN